MGLSDLPNELLENIFAAFGSAHDINSLLQTCQRFCRHFNSFLYKYAVENCCAEVSQWAGIHGRVDSLTRLIAKGTDAVIHSPETTPLFKAAEHGQVAVLQFLIERGVDLNMNIRLGYDWYNALHIAAQHGHEAIIRQLFDAGVKVDARFRDGCPTALTIAASLGHDGLVSFLLERGASVMSKDGFERTALLYAAGHCSLPIFEKLLGKISNEGLQEMLEEFDAENRTLLTYAAEYGNLDVVKLLLRLGAHPIGASRSDTPLRVAIEYEQNHVVQFLLDQGVCPNESQTPRQYAPLPLAANIGNHEAIRMLLEHGADINYVLPWGQTPLGLASWQGYYHAVKRLLEAGAPLNNRPFGRLTLLESALRHGHGEVALLLLQRGADRTGCSHKGTVTLLSLGARNNDFELVKSLLEEGVDIDVRNIYEQTALMVAAMNARTEMARTLVEKGASIVASDLWGRTALAIAAERGCLGVVLAILDSEAGSLPTILSTRPEQHVPSDNGRAIDVADEHGRTPLFYATVNGHHRVVSTLLSRGSVAWDSTTSAGRTPRSVAAQWARHRELSQLDSLMAIQKMYEDPREISGPIDMTDEVEEGRIVSLPFFDELEDWDLRQRFHGEYRCCHCPGLMNDYAVRFLCSQCKDDASGDGLEAGYSICPECVAGGRHCLDSAHCLQKVGKVTG